jgi:hypothetical protein
MTPFDLKKENNEFLEHTFNYHPLEQTDNGYRVGDFMVHYCLPAPHLVIRPRIVLNWRG